VEAPVRALGRTLAGEHAGRVLLGALEREDASREREAAGQVLLAQEARQLRPVLAAGERDARELRAGERLDVVLGLDGLPAHAIALAVCAVARASFAPALERDAQRRIQPFEPIGQSLTQHGQRLRLRTQRLEGGA
jgi:hypothetical protein